MDNRIVVRQQAVKSVLVIEFESFLFEISVLIVTFNFSAGS